MSETNIFEIEHEFSPYNPRAWNKPWGAIVEFEGRSAKYNFRTAKLLNDGNGGTINIACKAGDIIAWGQRHRFRPNQSWRYWFVVDEMSEIHLVTEKEALLHWRNLEMHRQAAERSTPLKPPENEPS